MGDATTLTSSLAGDPISRSPRMVVAGAVSSTRRILQGLLRNGADVVGILGLSASQASRTSGHQRLDDLAREAGIPWAEFTQINAPEITAIVRSWRPDLLFVVGLSQIVHEELLTIPRIATIGFHPTWLPEGRGRAPMAWLALENRSGAATFFVMDEGTDTGAILAQEPFHVNADDYALDIEQKLLHAIDRALDRWIPRVLRGEWDPISQQESLATYYGRRAPSDGLIEWSWDAQDIRTLIRATSRPHPGAYTYAAGCKLIVWQADLELNMPFRGALGRILSVDSDGCCLVQAGRGLLWLREMEFEVPDYCHVPPALKVGMRLGYAPQDEIHALRSQVSQLERTLRQLEESTSRPTKRD